MTSRLVITPGEPAGIGPDCVIRAAQQQWDFPWLVVADAECLRARAAQLSLPLTVKTITADDLPHEHQAHTIYCLHTPLQTPSIAGKLDPSNAQYVLRCLAIATELCQQQQCQALVTGPINKAVINDAGIPFTGHTEWLADKTNTEQVVMLLATGHLRVALVTTHLPLRQVADAITADKLAATLRIVNQSMRQYFTDATPEIHVLGLNPHAGEGGHLGDEEINIITPVIEKLNREGFHCLGPLSADTAFVNKNLNHASVFVAMYHDQGLPVIKQVGFGQTVNITLGLPIIRTSVDHGTAQSLAGTDHVDPSSLMTAMKTAYRMSEHAACT